MNFSCKQIILGRQMQNHADFKVVKKLRPREHLKLMDAFSLNDSMRVGILSGLQRTGKTTLLKQWLQNLPYEEQSKAAYLSIDAEDMAAVTHDLRLLRDNGYKYIAIDEITRCKDFIDRSDPLGNTFARSGMKIFITGTDSLAFWFASRDKLFNREMTLHTTHIPFAEWSDLTDQRHLDDYIRFGGLLNRKADQGDLEQNVQIPLTIDEIYQYIYSAICKNIQNSLKRCDNGIYAGVLEPFLQDDAMLEAIFNIFVYSTFQEFIQQLDLSKRDQSLYNLDNKLASTIAEIAKVPFEDTAKHLEFTTRTDTELNDTQFSELEQYLRHIQVFTLRPGIAFTPINPTHDDFHRYNKINDSLNAQNIAVQPRLRFACANSLAELLDSYCEILGADSKNKIKKIFLDGVYDLMQKDIVLAETMFECKRYGMMNILDNWWPRYASLPITAYRAIFPKSDKNAKDKEISMIIENKQDQKFYLVEIKHSSARIDTQSKCLLDNDVLNRITPNSKEIPGRSVLYHNETCFEHGIKYVNIEDYLNILHREGIEAAIELLT